MRRRFEGVSVDEGEGGGSEDASCARGRAPRRRARAGAADAFRLPEGKHSERASFWRSILGVAVHVARLTLGQQRYGSASTPCLPAGGRPVHPLGVRDELGCTGCRSGVEQGGKVRRKAPALRRTSRKGTKAGGTRAKRAERNTDGACVCRGAVWRGCCLIIIIQEFLFPCSCAPAQLAAAPLTTLNQTPSVVFMPPHPSWSLLALVRGQATGSPGICYHARGKARSRSRGARVRG